MATYVKAYAFFISIIVLIGLCVAAGILYGENQRTSDLFKTLMSDFETKMVNITTNNSVLMSTLTTNFQTQMATMNTQIETLATAKGSLEAQVATLTIFQTNYNDLLLRQTNITQTLNTSWSLFTKSLHKGMLEIEKANDSVNVGKVNFTTAYGLLNATTYVTAEQNANSVMVKCNVSKSLLDDVSALFTAAFSKVSDTWTVTLLTKYSILRTQALNMTYELGQAGYFMKEACSLYAGGNVTGGDARKGVMVNHWNCYRTSSALYLTDLKAINDYITT